jgi:mRNA-degrading endonuclease RelE of RelBE toxin-antitoxin system
MKWKRMTFDTLAEFDKDLKQLLKKYRSLNEDLDEVKNILKKLPDERPPFSFRISDLSITTCVIKIKKIASKSLKGRGVNSGFRLIYAWFEKEQRIVLIELYHKNEKGNEDRKRILQYFK